MSRASDSAWKELHKLPIKRHTSSFLHRDSHSASPGLSNLRSVSSGRFCARPFARPYWHETVSETSALCVQNGGVKLRCLIIAGARGNYVQNPVRDVSSNSKTSLKLSGHHEQNFNCMNFHNKNIGIPRGSCATHTSASLALTFTEPFF